ncbi:hypothetical protein [Pseudorhodobacter sp.]|uniref:hypothetical protein n=1 Tax=Pseudorhodobacter sp. TaxID=1934400 RepID=UPI002648E49D|nr:hypothetical protein [Pseudorhodobacter sp.]MDN5785625.1 hypothetical protein [Pseudorhodobacter sp.]
MSIALVTLLAGLVLVVLPPLPGNIDPPEASPLLAVPPVSVVSGNIDPPDPLLLVPEPGDPALLCPAAAEAVAAADAIGPLSPPHPASDRAKMMTVV